MSNQMMRRAQLVQPKPYIIAEQTNTPIIEVNLYAGVLKARGSSGFLTRSIQTPIQTNIKANKVPILVISPTISPGTKPAKTLTNAKMIQFDLCGVYLRENLWQQTIATHGVKHPRLPHQHHQYNR